VSVEVVAADAPFLADLVGLKVAATDPIAHGLLLDLQAAGDLLDREELGVGTGSERRSRDAT
jgi:hypothetical protein